MIMSLIAKLFPALAEAIPIITKTTELFNAMIDELLMYKKIIWRLLEINNNT